MFFCFGYKWVYRVLTLGIIENRFVVTSVLSGTKSWRHWEIVIVKMMIANFGNHAASVYIFFFSVINVWLWMLKQCYATHLSHVRRSCCLMVIADNYIETISILLNYFYYVYIYIYIYHTYILSLKIDKLNLLLYWWFDVRIRTGQVSFCATSIT